MTAVINRVTKSHYTGSLLQKQHGKLQKPTSSLSPDDITLSFVESLPQSCRDVLNYLAALEQNHVYVCPSEETIGKRIGCTSRTVRRALVRLKELGFVATYQRYNQSLLYKLSDVFWNQQVRKVFARFCSTFKFLCVFYLSSVSAFLGNVLLENNSYFNNSVMSSSSIHTSKRGRGIVNTDSGVSMVIRGIKGINLTKWGQIKLSAFPDAAILHAQDALKRVKRPDDPFKWFFAVCNKWCKKSNIEPSWQHSYELGVKYKMPENAPMLLKEENRESAAHRSPNLEKPVKPRFKEFIAPPQRIITQEDKIIAEATMMSLEKTPEFRYFLARPAQKDEELRAAAEAYGPVHIPSALEIQARIDARKKALTGKAYK